MDKPEFCENFLEKPMKIRLIIDDVEHILEQPSSIGRVREDLLHDGHKLPYKVNTVTGHVEVDFDNAPFRNDQNVTTCKSLRGLVNGFFTLMINHVSLPDTFVIEWYTLTCDRSVDIPAYWNAADAPDFQKVILSSIAARRDEAIT